MTDSESIIESTVHTSKWDEAIQFYTRILGSPKKEGQNEVFFAFSESENELRVIRSEDEEKLITTLKPPYYAKARTPKQVEEGHEYLLKRDKNAFSIAAPHQIGPSGKVLTLALVGYGNPCLFAGASFVLEGDIVCIIHNPDWN